MFLLCMTVIFYLYIKKMMVSVTAPPPKKDSTSVSVLVFFIKILLYTQILQKFETRTQEGLKTY